VNNRGFLIAHAVRGPILLITVGVLFAMHQAGFLPFQRTWPLLIIVLGIMKLVERSVAPPRLPVGPPFGPPPYTRPANIPPPPPYQPPPPYTPPPGGDVR
jgi:hypothetical protein